MTLRIATRGSKLALWQAEHVRARLLALRPEAKIELLVLKTQGDKILDVALAKVGGKGLFVKEIEDALLENRADLAVHSMKDVPSELPTGLGLAAILEREDPRDAFLSNKISSPSEIPQGATLGTSSLRRAAQILAWRPDLKIELLRGNVDTRLAKLDEGRYDAILLAAAGLKRLGFGQRITGILDLEQMIPAVGQGAVGVECRLADSPVLELIRQLDHADTSACVQVEREFNLAIGGSCQIPAGCHARILGDQFRLDAFIASPDGSKLIRRSASGLVSGLRGSGSRLAAELLDAGGRQLLSQNL
jgi:hydroxymethylbilane synthase